ncbi:amino acid ABC transporter membrane protein 1 (PAAT family) [Hydrogenispora ethanolica]|jgi:putative glutamine transport system permease protein|uniref:Amino acid ABC transporter membrane protein 1 (PAAT family) n=1 Tax=Hydrogenispora ethanolica TaxID=1082276 RepID=A0A4R1R2Y5_HYDET|nr:amino acid ABC transporter permease [Hydrogenispora ethanolica]TCL59766.1 amino acid ABC transporter membrane protein 1 (PAAT family) [Hydrogenispora ethanolica]
MVGPFAWFKWEALFKEWHVFAEGLGTTALVAILALGLALALGIVFGAFSTSHWKSMRIIARWYVELIQNTPLVIQVFILYNALPHLGINLPTMAVGVLGVGGYHGAYIAEVIRAGIQAIPKGQKEAAYSQGFSYWEAMRYVILPQAKKVVFPPLTNQAVYLIKNTSVMAMIAGGDLMYRADSWSSNNLYYGPAYVITGLLYLCLCLPLARYARHLEQKAEVAA